MRSLGILVATISLIFFLSPRRAGASSYDAMILADRPVLYLPLSAPHGSEMERDLSPRGHRGAYLPRTRLPTKTRMPNGDLATVFDGYSQYLEVRSAREFSVPRRGALTIEAWMRPDTLEFSTQESSGYVHWAGKGEPGQHEYVLRMYSKTNSAGRPNRISGYAYNPAGNEGSGSYFQDRVRRGEWIHVAVIIDTRPKPGASTGIVSIFKNGVLRKTTPLSQFDVHPEPGDAPVRVATRDFHSFFKGAVGKFALYAHAVSESRLLAHFSQMRNNPTP